MDRRAVVAERGSPFVPAVPPLRAVRVALECEFFSNENLRLGGVGTKHKNRYALGRILKIGSPFRHRASMLRPGDGPDTLGTAKGGECRGTGAAAGFGNWCRGWLVWPHHTNRRCRRPLPQRHGNQPVNVTPRLARGGRRQRVKKAPGRGTKGGDRPAPAGARAGSSLRRGACLEARCHSAVSTGWGVDSG